jgi:hypothetical protein
MGYSSMYFVPDCDYQGRMSKPHKAQVATLQVFFIPPLDIAKINYYFILYETYILYIFILHDGGRTLLRQE